jgi:hypothetical protein
MLGIVLHKLQVYLLVLTNSHQVIVKRLNDVSQHFLVN